MDQKEILLEEYKTLRHEITQSIQKQHQILLSGYTLSLAVAGYMIGGENMSFESDNLIGLSILPFLLLAMSCLWIVECNRMVRASYFIGYKLWNKILPTDIDKGGWEGWVRSKDDKNSTKFRIRQDFFQRIVVVIIPMLLSVIGLYIGFRNSGIDNNIFFSLEAAVILIWGFLFFNLRVISNLAAVEPKVEIEPKVEKINESE